MKDMEADLNMARKFHLSKKGNMTLTRSKCKKLVTVTNFDRNHPKFEFFKILAWSANKNKLNPKEVSSKLEFELNNYFY